MRPEQLIAESFSEGDKAIMRANLETIASRMSELRDMGAWQKLLGHQARFEWSVMIERVASYRNALD